MKKRNLKKFMTLLTATSLAVTPLSSIVAMPVAEHQKINGITAIAKSNGVNTPDLAIDGRLDTYYRTPDFTSMESHYKSIDLELDGLYEVSKINIFNNKGSYNHYQIYASQDGVNFEKVGYKTSNDLPTEEGESYLLDNVKASVIRINLAYNSQNVEGNLAEVEVFGSKIGEVNKVKDPIKVTDFKDTPYSVEYEKFETDEVYATNKTIQEMSDLVGRVIGNEYRESFIFEKSPKSIKGKDQFEIETTEDGKVIIRGNNGISMASGFNYYLRHYCNVDYSPLFVSHLKMPDQLPQVDGKIIKDTQYDERYALNFCTYSYTMAFWGWEEYEAFLDWAAMSGINLMLDIVGQEEVIRRTFEKYDYTDQEIKEYISGPAYLAWYYMQNMYSYGGTLPDSWFEERVELARKMHDRMQAYGIRPVKMGFSGMVPEDFTTKNPDAAIIDQGGWCGFSRSDMLRGYVNEGQRDYFAELADAFYEEQKAVFGDITNYYSVDPFHEGGNIGDMDPSKIYGTVQSKMLEHDEDAVWVIQQWSGSLTDQKLQGLVDKGKVLILDLSSEYNSYAQVMERNEVPWVWDMVHCFGGKAGMEADAPKISSIIPETYDKSNYMTGIGIAPEAIARTPMIYELFWDMTWTKDPFDPLKWLNGYQERRYGHINEDIVQANILLLDTVYSTDHDIAESVINARPTEVFTSAGTWGRGNITYDVLELEKALRIYIDNYEEFKDSEAYRYDLLDLARQDLSNSALTYHQLMMQAYKDKDLEKFNKYSTHFLDLISLQNELLDVSDNMRVGKWIEDSRTMLDHADDWTKDLFEFNARSLITTWGDYKASDWGGLKDYAHKQWAGLTEDMYYKKWEKFINNYRVALETGKAPKQENWFFVEWEWVNRKSDEEDFGYSTKPSGADLFELVNKVYDSFSLVNLDKFVGDIEINNTENVALGKKVTSSNQTNDGELSNLTDGNKISGWVAKDAQWPVEFIVDLEESVQIEGIEIALEQVAGGFPLTYKLEAWVEGQWVKLVENNSGTVTSQIYEPVGVNTEKIRYTLNSLDSQLIPEVMELMVYGKPATQTKVNIAKGQKVIVNEGKHTQNIEHITDGRLETACNVSTKLPGYEFVPGKFEFEMDKETFVEDITVHFEIPGFRYQFEVYTVDAEGNKKTVLDKTTNTEDLDQSYNIAINDEVQKVVVDLLRRAEGGSFYLCAAGLAELEVFSPTDQALESVKVVENMSKAGSVSVNGGKPNGIENIIDGNLGSSHVVNHGPGYAFSPGRYEWSLNKDTFIESTNIYFDKAGYRYKFEVYTMDEEGNKTVILDKKNNLEDLPASFKLDINDSVQKIVVDLLERAPGGSYYLATSSLAEIEVFGEAKSIAKEAAISSNLDLPNLEQLIDEDIEQFVTLDSEGDKVITLSFENPVDIRALELIQKDTMPLEYAVDYRIDKDKEWYSFISKTTSNPTNQVIKQFSNSILAKEVKITLYNPIIHLSEIKLYRKDFTGDLNKLIETLTKRVEKLTIGEYAGSYNQLAYNLFRDKLEKIKQQDLSHLNSQQIQEMESTIRQDYGVFLTSAVSIERIPLLVELEEVRKLLEVEDAGDKQVLQAAYDEATITYFTYKVLQTELDEATQKLEQAKEKYNESREKGIQSFGVKGQIGETEWDQNNGTITVIVPYDFDIEKIKAEVSLDKNYTSNVDFTQPIDFTNPVKCTVTNEVKTFEYLIKVIKAEQEKQSALTMEVQETVTGGQTLEVVFGLGEIQEKIYAQDFTISYDEKVFDLLDVEGIGEKNNAIYKTEGNNKVRILVGTEEGLVTGDKGVKLTLRVKNNPDASAHMTTIYAEQIQFGSIKGQEADVISTVDVSQKINVKPGDQQIDKSILESMIAEAKELSQNASIGSEVGQYPEQAKEKLDLAIQNAEKVMASSISQSEVDIEIKALKKAIEVFKASIIEEKDVDINGDGKIDVADLAMIAYYYHSNSTSVNWDKAKKADLNHDGKIDIGDLSILASKILN